MCSVGYNNNYDIIFIYIVYWLIIVNVRLLDVLALYENESIPSHLTVTVALDGYGINIISISFYLSFFVANNDIRLLDFEKRFGKSYENQFAEVLQFTVWTLHFMREREIE